MKDSKCKDAWDYLDSENRKKHPAWIANCICPFCKKSCGCWARQNNITVCPNCGKTVDG